MSGLACERHHAASTSTGVVPPGVELVASGSPGLAAVLGFIPGVGAMYNGEYAKGFIHVLIFATLIWAADNVSGLFGIAIAAFVIYMPIEAYQTAKARRWDCSLRIRSGSTTCSAPGLQPRRS